MGRLGPLRQRCRSTSDERSRARVVFGLTQRPEGFALLFDDLTLETKILIGLLAPLTLTLICWLVGPLLTGWRNWARSRRWTGFWVMLLASYLIFAVALGGGRFLSGNDEADPSSQLIQ
jgi:hypothetical protein